MPPSGDVVACQTCGLAQRITQPAHGFAVECARCGAVIHENRAFGTEVTAALTLGALILYLPANAYPILRMTFHGVYSENTVWQGIVSLWEHQEWLVAVIVFLASILVPLLKLSGLLYLVASVRLGATHYRALRTWIYRFIDVIGPWAMLDVFLLAILVALVKMGEIATVLPGPGLIAFAGVVVLTIFASATFDPRLIWTPEDKAAAT